VITLPVFVLMRRAAAFLEWVFAIIAALAILQMALNGSIALLNIARGATVVPRMGDDLLDDLAFATYLAIATVPVAIGLHRTSLLPVGMGLGASLNLGVRAYSGSGVGLPLVWVFLATLSAGALVLTGMIQMRVRRSGELGPSPPAG
jgi:hypothetical protein